uniref:Capsid protein n=1 Tax=viral metagenome TaxID=1070528 RepID=A0A6C0HC97_9ZZZZ
MFSNEVKVNYHRPMYNPVYTSNKMGIGAGGAGEFSLISDYDLVDLKVIQTFYSSKIKDKLYEHIPNDYDKYIKLYYAIEKIKSKITNQKLLTMVQIAQDTLQGAINAYALYGTNIALTIDKVGLKKTIEDILSGKNEKFIEMAQATGQLVITKTFKLAPLFNYYIIVYGMPAFGVGFDPIKIKFLTDVLVKNGINPYK